MTNVSNFPDTIDNLKEFKKICHYLLEKHKKNPIKYKKTEKIIAQNIQENLYNIHSLEEQEAQTKLIKSLLPLPVLEHLGDSILYNENKSLKFLFEENLYLYDDYEKNKNYIKVVKIGNIDVNEAIDKIKKEFNCKNQGLELILLHKEVLKYLNIIENDYFIFLEYDKQIYKFNFENSFNNIPENIFYKEVKVNNINNIEFEENFSNRKILYLFNNCSKILNEFLAISKSDKDINLFKKLTYKVDTKETNLDLLYKSTFLLLEKNTFSLPKYFYNTIIKKYISNSKYFVFLDEKSVPSKKYGCNKMFLNDQIDYEMITSLIISSFSCSQYEIIDEKYVRIYNKNKGKYVFNVKVHIIIINKIVEQIVAFNYLNETLPTFTLKEGVTNRFEYNNTSLKSYDDLREYLNSMNIFEFKNISPITFNEYKKTNEKVSTKFNGLKMDERLIDIPDGINFIKDLKEFSFLSDNSYKYNYEDLKEAFLLFSSEYIKGTVKKNTPNVNNYINEINNLSDFFKLNLRKQYKILISILNKYSKINNKNLSSNFIRIILNGKDIDSVEIKNKMRALILTFLNLVVVYGYKKNINVTDIDFSLIKINDVEIENEEYLDLYRQNKLLERLEKKVNNFNYELDTGEVNCDFLNLNFKEKKYWYLCDCFNIEETSLETVNETIIMKIKNSLLNGNIFIDEINMDDISSTVVKFKIDVIDDICMSLTVGELFEQLCNKTYRDSIFK